MKPDGVEILDADNRDDVEGILALQVKYFPMPEDTGLRLDLLRHYFFSDLIRDGLVRCIFGRRDGKIVCYLAYTPFPNTYQDDGRARHRLHIYRRILFNVLFRPNRIRNIGALMKRHAGESQGGRPSVYPPDTADILFLATKWPHGKWIPPGGQSRLTVRVFEEAVRDLARLGMKDIFMTVRANNGKSLRFCESLGCYRIENVVTSRAEEWRHFYYRIPPGITFPA